MIPNQKEEVSRCGEYQDGHNTHSESMLMSWSAATAGVDITLQAFSQRRFFKCLGRQILLRKQHQPPIDLTTASQFQPHITDLI